jgi:predicted Zn-dependent peptidase
VAGALALCGSPAAFAAKPAGGAAKPAAPPVPATAPVAQATPVLHAEKFVLPENGLEVILCPDHALPLVAVNVWYHVGPANEPAQRTGFAHLFEHLMFQGSAHVGDDQHFKLLESRGASLINGTTSFDRTNYFETVPANELELALWLESDRMGFLAASINPVSLENQRQVVMNERRWRVDNSPYGPTQEKLIQTLLPPSHPYYGNVIGSMADLDKATVQDVKRFYEQYYAPANATIAISGDFAPADAKALVARYFAGLPRRQKPAAVAVQAPTIDKRRRVTVKEKVELAQLNKAWLSPKAFAAGDAEADVLAEILGQGEASRLHRRLVYELGLAQEVSVDQQSYQLLGMFTVTATARPGASLARIEREVDQAIAAMQTTPPTAAEVSRAKNQIRLGLIHRLQTLGGFGGKADLLNRYNHYLGTPDGIEKDLTRYARVTPAAVQAFAKSHLRADAQVVVSTLPEASNP